MSREILMRGLCSGLFGFVCAWAVFSRYDAETGSESTDCKRQKYLPYIPGSILPLYLLAISVLNTFFYGVAGAARLTLSMCFGVFLHISAYYIVLIPALPFFRKHISARACAMLWIVPNYLYITSHNYMKLPKPKLVFYVPGNIAWILFFVWLAGFAAVLIWKTTEHFVFRRKILSGSYAVFSSDILAVWEKAVEDARIRKRRFKLVCSPNVKTPLSVGLFWRTVRVVLPEQNYAPEELELILRHEIIHIAREDSWSKYFLVFCAAMCWFNPLMRMAMRRSGEDIERSCDETVLLNADEHTRKKYADLLLDAAGDERGFTTCLSASAKAMRDRLKNITEPAKRQSGAVIVGLAVFLLFMTSGYAALAYGDRSGSELIYKNRDYSEYSLRSVSVLTAGDEYGGNYDMIDYNITDEDAFHTYLSGLSLSELTGNYSFSSSDTKLNCWMDTPRGILFVILQDYVVQITGLSGEDSGTETYYMQEGIDWEYINGMMMAHPVLDMYLTRDGDPYGKNISARLDMLWKTVDGQKQVVYDAGIPKETTHGLFGYGPVDEISFSFSEELASPCTVMIESWDRSKSDTVTQEDLSEPFSFTPPSYSAHYTVYASFNDQKDTRYDAAFRFDIGDIGQ